MPTKGLPYPNFARACFVVTIDNGGIHRTRSVKMWRRDYKRWVVNQPDLTEIDTWCSTLTSEQMYDWAIGGEGEPERERIKVTAPAFADQILDQYFEEIC